MTRRPTTSASRTSAAEATVDALVHAARQLSDSVDGLGFPAPVAHVYNPLDYAWDVHEAFLRRYGAGRRRIVFLGMNPGPFGMMQTGVPFGEIAAVRDWLRLEGTIRRAPREHPRRPVQGFDCPRSEVSGRRLWGLFAERFGQPARFFARHFVVNYCPLAFLAEGAQNLTPDKLPAEAAAPLFDACDRHLQSVVAAVGAEWVIGVGDFAGKRAQRILAGQPVRIGRILHPSPASPAANRGWATAATAQLEALGIWEPGTA